MNCAVATFAFSGLLLSGITLAQAPSEPGASAMVSPSTASSSIKPDQLPAPETSTDVDIVADPASLLPDLPPVPRAKASLIGGSIERMDRVRDRVTIRVFGGGRMNVLFDPRTKVYRGGTEGTIADLHEGDRVALDTILDGSTVFARSIRLKAGQAVGETQGVIVKYRTDREELTIRDAISPNPVRVRLSSSTKLRQGDRTMPMSSLAVGSLVSVRFNSERDGRDLAREISILALPGTRYIFAGQIVHLDLRTGLLVINSSTDHKTYEVYLDPSAAPDENLHTGSVVTVTANFEGSRYVARDVTIDPQGR